MLVETSEQNIVFVNFNYRVGLFGFLAGKEVKDDGDLNVGLLDQRLLLQWVQENISAVSLFLPLLQDFPPRFKTDMYELIVWREPQSCNPPRRLCRSRRSRSSNGGLRGT